MARHRLKKVVVPALAAVLGVVLSVSVIDAGSASAMTATLAAEHAARHKEAQALGTADPGVIPQEESVPAPLPPLTPLGTTDGEIPVGDVAPVRTPSPPATAAPSPSSALSIPSGFDPDTATVLERDEFSTTYDGGDGSEVTKVSLVPSSIEDRSGAWVPIETELATTGPAAWRGRGGAEVDLHPLKPEFAEHADDAPLLSLTNDDHSLGFALRGAASSVLERDLAPWANSEAKSHLEYREVLAGVDLVYDVTEGAVKENLRLNRVPAVGESSWTWAIDAPGLTASRDALGNVLFADASGSTIFSMPAPVLWDSSGTSRNADAEARGSFTLIKDGDTTLLKVSAPHAWLADPKRVYPVLVDPTTYNDDVGVSSVTSFKSGGESNSGLVQLGNTNESGIWRSLVHFDYWNAIKGRQVLHAGVEVLGVEDGTTEARTGGVHDVTAPRFEGLGAQLAALTIAEGTASNTGDDSRLAKKFAEWSRNGVTGGSLFITGDETPDRFSYRLVTLSLYLETRPFPIAGWNPLPANDLQNQSLTPTLHANGEKNESGAAMNYLYRVSENPDPQVGTIWDSGWSGGYDHAKVPALVLKPNTWYYWRVWVYDVYDGINDTSTVSASNVFRFRTADPVVPRQDTSAPGDRSVVVTTTPQLDVVPVASSRPHQYAFRIATGPDATTGQVATSGWRDEHWWDIPAGVLQDGSTYTWTVMTRFTDVTGEGSEWGPFWVSRLTVNQRITNPGPAPTDSAGPVTVNLANGNVGMAFTSPTVSTLGGDIGMNFTYNSQKLTKTGLIGRYFTYTGTGNPPQDFSGADVKPVLQRTDTQLNFDWQKGSPGEGLPPDNFMARWNGFIRVPEAGQYQFETSNDDGAVVSINGSKVLEKWAVANDRPNWDTAPAVTLGAGQVPIEVKYFEGTGDAGLKLLVRKVGTTTASLVPADWLSSSRTVLPGGWGASTPLAGDLLSFSKAEVKEGSIVFTDTYGDPHTYTKKSAGGYEPPTGETGVAAIDDGRATLADASGVTTVFNSDGSVASVTSPDDAKKPSAPVVSYRSGGLVDRISDRLSGTTTGSTTTYARSVRYIYGGDKGADLGLASDNWPGTDTLCPSDSSGGLVAAPTGMLCRIMYPDHASGSFATDTTLLYNPAGDLVRITDPGNEITTFSYDAGRIATVRDSLANDWLLSTAGRPADAVARAMSLTDIAYDAAGRPATVTLPAPDGATAAARPRKTYTWPGGNTAHVDVAGLTVPTAAASNGHAVTVTYDAAYRTLSSRTASGLESRTEWNNRDQQLSSTSPQGLKSTSMYDHADRRIHTWGRRRPAATAPVLSPPAPVSPTPPRSTTGPRWALPPPTTRTSRWQARPSPTATARVRPTATSTATGTPGTRPGSPATRSPPATRGPSPFRPPGTTSSRPTPMTEPASGSTISPSSTTGARTTPAGHSAATSRPRPTTSPCPSDSTTSTSVRRPASNCTGGHPARPTSLSSTATRCILNSGSPPPRPLTTPSLSPMTEP